ncbi:MULTISPECIES: SMI1/KNR4 family protein [Legionella]|nr:MULTISPECIES: SMI1/KNR4 family protein [Legionella]MCP0913110.1 SMI1/KNR4 family protein [Legionella sp. 27cVA30]
MNFKIFQTEKKLDVQDLDFKPHCSCDFPPAAEEHLLELESHCGHKLPDLLRHIYKTYNGGKPQSDYYDPDNLKEDLNCFDESGYCNIAYFFKIEAKEAFAQSTQEISKENSPEKTKSMHSIWDALALFNKNFKNAKDKLPFAKCGKNTADGIFYLAWSKAEQPPEVWLLKPFIGKFFVAKSLEDFLQSLKKFDDVAYTRAPVLL